MNQKGSLTTWHDDKGFGFKGSFQFGFWLCVALNLLALGWLLFWPDAAFARRELGIELLVIG